MGRNDMERRLVIRLILRRGKSSEKEAMESKKKRRQCHSKIRGFVWGEEPM